MPVLPVTPRLTALCHDNTRARLGHVADSVPRLNRDRGAPQEPAGHSRPAAGWKGLGNLVKK
jgi:hypothetical protein